MHTRVLHVEGKRWAALGSHMDNRGCPECGATVNGRAAQHMHLLWHEQLAEILENRGEEEGQPVPWTAVVDGRDDPEAISG
jgi:hypothetical protein